MLGEKNAMATIAVRQLAAARKFYEETLGLSRVGPDEPGTVAYRSGNSTVLVYESQYAGTNRATAATWTADGDIEALIESLRAKGVKFEHYDLPETRREGDIHIAGSTKVAWFKDPDGNILSIASE